VLNTPLAVPLTSRAISGLPWSKAGRKMSSNAPPGQAAAAVGSASVWISATDRGCGKTSHLTWRTRRVSRPWRSRRRLVYRCVRF